MRKRRKLDREPVDFELVDVLGAIEILQAVLAEVADA